MEKPEADLIQHVLDIFVKKHLDNNNDRLDTVITVLGRIEEQEKTLMATMQQLTDAINGVNTSLDRIRADNQAQNAEIEKLKQDVQNMGLTNQQTDILLTALNSIGEKAASIDAEVPEPIEVPPVEEPPTV